MYFTIHIDIRPENPQTLTKANHYIKNLLKGLYWVRPLKNLYIIKCNNVAVRMMILKKIKEFRNNNKKLIFLASPLINTGNYVGVAPSDLWEHIKKITARDYEEEL
ncbi:MAG: hypothetical protein K8R31_09890 [Bacteroidales bacterium]|nr:hypothetical protein [Bacteroidales bacterium]